MAGRPAQAGQPSENQRKGKSQMKKKTKGRIRAVPVMVRMTQEEKTAFDRRVERSGLSQREYFLRCVLGKKIRVLPGTQELKDIKKELNHIGTNINQIAKQLNSHDFRNADHCLDGIGTELGQMTDALICVFEEIREEG
jgi:hypothetical protein